MASVQQKGDCFYCQFYFFGKRHTISFGAVSHDEAEARRGQVSLLLLRIKQGLLKVPLGVTISDFILADGDVVSIEQAVANTTSPTSFAAFRQKYLDAQRVGAMEANSLATVEMHLRHFERTFGGQFPVHNLSLADLQRHVAERAKKQYRGKPLSPVTLRKEVASFRAAWNWGALNSLTAGPFPCRGLVYPKGDEKPPFQTREEIERRIAAGLPEAEAASLWDSLFLHKADIEALLAHVKARASHPWIFPLVAFAAHTGARRSELLRVQVGDVDLAAGSVLIREKKRSRQQRTSRQVSLTPFLKEVLRDWLAVHPGGPALFCQAGSVTRSKKRSRSTGHLSEKKRPSTLNGRLATVRSREAPGVVPVTRDEAHDHFKRTLSESKWEVLKGFHVLRHSFISCLASAGVDQRIIDDFVGHQTDEQRRRYRHLLPNLKSAAIGQAFSCSEGRPGSQPVT